MGFHAGTGLLPALRLVTCRRAQEGILEDATAKTAEKALAWQITKAMKEQKRTKATLAGE